MSSNNIICDAYLYLSVLFNDAKFKGLKKNEVETA